MNPQKRDLTFLVKPLSSIISHILLVCVCVLYRVHLVQLFSCIQSFIMLTGVWIKPQAFQSAGTLSMHRFDGKQCVNVSLQHLSVLTLGQSLTEASDLPITHLVQSHLSCTNICPRPESNLTKCVDDICVIAYSGAVQYSVYGFISDYIPYTRLHIFFPSSFNFFVY